MLKKMMIPALLAGMLALAGCTDDPDVYITEETRNFEETEAPTEIPTLSEEEISDLLASVTEAEKKTTQNTNETAAVQSYDEPEDFGTAVYLGTMEYDSATDTERYFYFYGDGSGYYVEQENGMRTDFTYSMTGSYVMFRLGEEASKMEAWFVNWLDDSTVEMDWESGYHETLTRLSDDPFAELHFYTNEILRERALDVYAQKNGYRPDGAEITTNYDGMLVIRLYDLMEDNHDATADWYTVDRFTGIGTNLLGESINLSDNPDASPETIASTETEEQPTANR